MMEKREKVSNIILTLFIILLIFTMLQFLSPLLLSTNTYKDFNGIVGVMDNAEKIDTMPIPLNMAYVFGDRLCHQKSERSFYINGNQMPFCSRCTAIWIGLTIGLLFTLLFKNELSSTFLMIIIFSLVPIGIDGTGQLLDFWESSNVSRVITGLIVGIPVGMALGIIVDEVKSLYKSKIN